MRALYQSSACTVCATGDLAQLAQGRKRTDLFLEIHTSGVLSACLVYFTLRCDDDPANHFHSGPANGTLVAWDQNTRNMPIETNVRAGQRVRLQAEHDHQAVRVGLPELRPEMVRGMVGHRELLGLEGPSPPAR